MQSPTPKTALRAWADSNEVTPAEFGRKMGYTYNHAYQLLRGEAEVTVDMLGRFVVAYGAEASRTIAAAFAQNASPNGAAASQRDFSTAKHQPTKRCAYKRHKTSCGPASETTTGTVEETVE